MDKTSIARDRGRDEEHTHFQNSQSLEEVLLWRCDETIRRCTVIRFELVNKSTIREVDEAEISSFCISTVYEPRGLLQSTSPIHVVQKPGLTVFTTFDP
jgi:hypothetical protein